MNDHHRLCRRSRGCVDLAKICRGVAGNPSVTVSHAKDIWKPPADKLVGHTNINRERDVVFRRRRGRGKADSRLVTTLKGVDPGFVHLFNFGCADFRLCLRITKKRLKRRTAHRFDAASGIDVGDGHLRAIT